MKAKGDFFWTLVGNYFNEYLPKVRRMSLGTINTYRYGMYAFTDFSVKLLGVQPDTITFAIITRDNMKKYVSWMVNDASLSVSTCNLRLSIIKSFLKYCSYENMDYMPIYVMIKSIPTQKKPQEMVEYMSEHAMKVVLRQPNPKTLFGSRNMMILVFMYDTACRVHELVDVKLGDLRFESEVPFVQLTGKGNKTRNVPLMGKTVKHLKQYCNNWHGQDKNRPLFYAKKDGKPVKLSTDAISVLVKKYGAIARTECLEVPKRCYPHLFRKTRSMHLYMKGMPLEQVANFLGHTSSATISYYAKANMKMLKKAIEKANPEVFWQSKEWKEPDLLKRLCGL